VTAPTQAPSAETISAPTARAVDVAARALQLVGAPESAARSVAESLVLAERMGHASHGLVRVLEYRQSVTDHNIDPGATPAVVRRQGATAVVDGHWGWGHLAAGLAADVAADLAQDNGVGVVAVRSCGHSGRLGEWVERIAAGNLIGIGLLSCGPSVAAPGGRRRVLGTNPLAVAMPARPGSRPLVLDFATAGIAEGKVRVAARAGRQIPSGVLQTEDGRPTTDPDDFYRGGAILPFGGHKGYGLSVMIQVLGESLCADPPSGHDPLANRLVLLAIAPGGLQPDDLFHDLIEEVQRRVRASAPDGAEVLLPGDVEARTVASQPPGRVTVSAALWTELCTIAGEGQGEL
jgi:LDH2 family malate/lactate/ureidoglycolate dehydrogenase